MQIERLNASKCFHYRGCEAQLISNGCWCVVVNGEIYEIEDCKFEDLKENIDLILDN